MPSHPKWRLHCRSSAACLSSQSCLLRRAAGVWTCLTVLASRAVEPRPAIMVFRKSILIWQGMASHRMRVCGKEHSIIASHCQPFQCSIYIHASCTRRAQPLALPYMHLFRLDDIYLSAERGHVMPCCCCTSAARTCTRAATGRQSMPLHPPAQQQAPVWTSSTPAPQALNHSAWQVCRAFRVNYAIVSNLALQSSRPLKAPSLGENACRSLGLRCRQFLHCGNPFLYGGDLACNTCAAGDSITVYSTAGQQAKIQDPDYSLGPEFWVSTYRVVDLPR